jgi:hypothetical protein
LSAGSTLAFAESVITSGIQTANTTGGSETLPTSVATVGAGLTVVSTTGGSPNYLTSITSISDTTDHTIVAISEVVLSGDTAVE